MSREPCHSKHLLDAACTYHNLLEGSLDGDTFLTMPLSLDSLVAQHVSACGLRNVASRLFQPVDLHLSMASHLTRCSLYPLALAVHALI